MIAMTESVFAVLAGFGVWIGASVALAWLMSRAGRRLNRHKPMPPRD